jgi:CheY-like chemotaxis protein
MPSVLVVDDDPGVLSAFEAFLQNEGYRVWTATHSAAALGQVIDARPDVVLLDLRMATVHGLEVLQLMRTAVPNTRAIIVSAFLNDDIRQRAFELGAYACLDKPVSLPELKICLTQVLAGAEVH